MRLTHCLMVLTAVTLTACSTTRSRSNAAAIGPETVMVTYRVKPGSEAEFQTLLARAWQIYRKEHLVRTEPHLIVHDSEAGGKSRYVEILTWASHDAPEQAPASVKAIWKEEHSLCESRGGHTGIEGGEVQIITGGSRSRGWP